MKFRYREEDLKQTIKTQIFPEAHDKVTSFPLKELALGQIIKMNGEKKLIGCVIEADEDGILVVLMHAFKVDKAIGYNYLEFANMQGIKVKEGILFYKVTIQFIDGTNYVIRLNKRNMKHLSNQNKNTRKIIDIMYDLNLREMNNKILKKNIKERRRSEIWYVITLIILFIFVMNISFKYIDDNFFLFIVIIIGSFIVHFILFLFTTLLIDYRKDRPFVREFNQINNEYQRTNDAEVLLAELSNLKNKPTKQDSINAFNLSMSTALYQTGQLEEAHTYLNNIQTTDENLITVVEEQREVFEGKREG